MNPLVSEGRQSPPILIVDKLGKIGEALAEKIVQDTQVVFVSQKAPKNEKIIFVPFEKKFPTIPQSTYSHIFLIDDADPFFLELLPSFKKKASEDNGMLILVLNVKNQKLINNEILEFKGTRTVLVGDIVDKNIHKSYVGKLLNQAKIRGKIEIPGDGMFLVYPVFFQDAVTGILEAAFGTSREKIYFLFPKDGISLLSFAHLIQKANPNITVDFGKEETIVKTEVNIQGKYLLEEKYPLEEKIRGMKIEVGKFKNDYSQGPNSYLEEKRDLRSFKTAIFFLLLFIFLPLISTLIFSFFGGIFLNAGKTGIKALELDLAAKYISTSQYFFSLSSKTSEILSSETFDLEIVEPLKIYSEENYKYTQGLMNFFLAIDYYKKGEAKLAVNSLKNFLLFIQRQKAENKSIDFLQEDLLVLTSGTIDTWPAILGFEGKKNYLILFQNNTVLRPTGGVVQALAKLTLNNGKIEDIKIVDPRILNSSVGGQVEPPFALRRYSKIQKFLLKDSSFDVDFREAAQDASYLYSLETEEKPDAVLSLNLNFLKKLLALTGPVNINGKKVDQRNILKLSEENSQDFLTQLIKETINELKKKIFPLGNLLINLSQDIKRKDLLVAFSDKIIQDNFTVNSFSNSLWDERLDSSKSINDTLGISEANLGDPNTQIERKVVHNLEINLNGQIEGRSKIEITNSGENDYKVYLRFVLPKSSVLTEVKLDGAEKDFTQAIEDPVLYEGKNFRLPDKIEVSTENKEKTLYGIYLEVPKQKLREIEITYSLPQKPLSTLSDFNYSFLFIKQPGVDFYPLEFNLVFPKEFKVLSFPKDVQGAENTVSFSKNLSEDYKLELDFSKK